MAEMKPVLLAFAALAPVLALGVAADASAERRGDQDAAYSQRRAGEIRPLREIEGAVVARMPGAAYLGPEYDAGSATYRLKFMRGGRVIWIDVDARTGRELGRSGN